MGRMDKHTSGLVYHDKVVVFVNYVERYLLRPHGRFPFGFQFDLDEVSATDALTFVLDTSVHLALSALDHVADIHPAKAAKPTEQIFLKADPYDPVGNYDLELLRHDQILRDWIQETKLSQWLHFGRVVREA